MVGEKVREKNRYGRWRIKNAYYQHILCIYITAKNYIESIRYHSSYVKKKWETKVQNSHQSIRSERGLKE